ncbi:MAG: hypothetical protein Q9204_008666 [Flavoplaca sp. TL-2023a]
MDPLSITASAATVIDAALKIVSYIVKVKDASDDLCTLKKELQLLRGELEDLVALSNRAEVTCDQASNNDAGPISRLPILQRLTDPDDNASPLACCQRKLEKLVKGLETTEGDSRGWERRLTVRRLIWPLKETATTKSLQKIKSLRDAIASGISLDTASLALDSNTRIRNVDQQAQTIQEELKHGQIYKWLSAPDTALSHYQASVKRAPATGEWFILSTDYKQWKLDSHGVYWLHGILGCGKTILVSTIIDDLSNHCDTQEYSLAYFYFDSGNVDRRECSNMLRALVQQLAIRNGDCLGTLNQSYLDHDKGYKQPNLQSLSTVLRSMVEICGKTFIVLDALDECSSQVEILEFIQGIESWQHAELHLLLTSRTETDISTTVESLSYKKYLTNIQSSLNTEDIRTHIRDRVANDTKLKRWRKDPKASQEIEGQLMDKAGGMYGSTILRNTVVLLT